MKKYKEYSIVKEGDKHFVCKDGDITIGSGTSERVFLQLVFDREKKKGITKVLSMDDFKTVKEEK